MELKNVVKMNNQCVGFIGVILMICSGCVLEGNSKECFDWSVLERHYAKKETNEGYVLAKPPDMISFFDNFDRRLEAYWLDGRKDVKYYRMYNWHFDTPNAYFSMDFDPAKCRVESFRGTPMFIESNASGQNVVSMDTLIFLVFSANTPFTESFLEVIKENSQKKDTIFQGEVFKNSYKLFDSDFENDTYSYSFRYELMADSVLITSHDIEFNFEYIRD
jgi:hypothetical protein